VRISFVAPAFAGRDTPLAQAIERYNSLSGPS